MLNLKTVLRIDVEKHLSELRVREITIYHNDLRTRIGSYALFVFVRTSNFGAEAKRSYSVFIAI